MTKNIEEQFFTKLKGWRLKLHPMGGVCWWNIAEGFLPHTHLPPISTSWDAFHEWVVPELVKKDSFFTFERARMKLSDCFFNDKTPQRALEWAMKELQS